MKMKRLFAISLFFILLITTACTDSIELDLPDGETFLVVEGWITNQPGPQEIKLSYTAPYFDDSPQTVVTNATVKIADDEGNETILNQSAPGTYFYPDSGTTGRSYKLLIYLPEGDTYESDFELLQPAVPIDSIAWQLSDRTPNADNDENPDDIYDVVIWTQEPAGKGDYYQWRSFLNGVEQREPFDIFTTSDDLVDGSPIPDFNVTDDLYSTPDTVTIDQEHISRAAYDFLTQVQTQTAFVGGPFDTPPAPIQGNVHNMTNPKKDALGFFGAAGRSLATTIVGE